MCFVGVLSMLSKKLLDELVRRSDISESRKRDKIVGRIESNLQLGLQAYLRESTTNNLGEKTIEIIL